MTLTVDRSYDVTIICMPDKPVTVGLSGCTIRFIRDGGYVDILINDVLVNRLERDEWEWLWEGLGRL
jgi:hypothetical protein